MTPERNSTDPHAFPEYEPGDWRQQVSTLLLVVDNICQDRKKDFAEDGKNPRKFEYLRAGNVRKELEVIQRILRQKVA